jgi:sterol desaturase/sphingolipid hydroxylase (fatty acid hydroxylase superfamily)
MFPDPFQGLKSVLHDSVFGHSPLVEKTLFAVLDMLSSPITGIKTRFHWFQILEAIVLTALVFAFARGALGTGFFGFLRYAFPKGAYSHASSVVDYKLNMVNYFTGSFFNLTWRLSIPFMTAGVFAALVSVFGAPTASMEWGVISLAIFLVALWVIDDLGYYLAHLAAHKIPALWAFHKVHHSAELLTIFTAGRVHPMEYAFIAPTRAATSALVLGPAMYLFGSEPTLATWYGISLWLAVSGALGEQLLHSHVWLSWGRFWDKIILSPCLHQIHHSSEPRHWDKNFAGRFSLWDWLFGTLYQPSGHETFRYGIYGEREQLHPSLTSAYLRPYWDLVPAKAWIVARADHLLGPWVGELAQRWMLLPTPKPPITTSVEHPTATGLPDRHIYEIQPGGGAPGT